MKPSRFLASLTVAVSLAIGLLLVACMRAPYTPRALDADPLQSHAARSPADVALAALVKASAYPGEWPPERWDLETLTLVAMYFSPRMTTVRAQASVADAEVASAAQGLPFGMQIAAEHHSRQLEGERPWSVGFSVALPLTGGGRRAARVDSAVALAEAARLDVAATAWRVRSDLRDALIQHLDASRRIASLVQQASTQRDMTELVRSRVKAGMYSARELGRELSAAAELDAQLAAQRARAQDAYSMLAGALGLPLDTVQRLPISDDALVADTELPDADTARELALKNRLDIQRRLLEFGAADAQLRLAIASQYPELSLSPGYLWDQGDRVWSLATELLFPAGARGIAGVREAEARRELAAQRFIALQMEVIAQTERSLAAWSAVAERERAAAGRAGLAQQQKARIGRAFEAGVAGRLDLVAAQLHALSTDQAVDEATIERLHATARMEDAIEKPLMGVYRRLPDSAQARSGGAE